MASEEARSVEVSARTVEEATQKGLAELGLVENQVTIEVLDYGRGGLLGLGAQDARVRLIERMSDSSVARLESEFDSSEVEETEEKRELQPSSPEPEIPEERAEIATLAVDILQRLVDLLDVRGKVVPSLGEDLVEEGDDPPLVLNITGPDLGVLIGRQGETLQSLQYLTRLMLSKQLTRWEPVVVDVESYRARRRRSLRQLALRMADRVASSQRRVVLEAMPANERRIVHITLHNHPQVTTKSIGDGDRRKVTIIPK